MKNNGLIIDLRRQLPWYKRYASSTSTALMWAIWLLLWRPVLLVVGIISLEKHHVIQHVFNALGIGIGHAITALLTCSVALLFWTKFVPASKVKMTQTKTIDDYAEHFHLPVETIQQACQQKISHVHYDEQGKIIAIEAQK